MRLKTVILSAAIASFAAAPIVAQAAGATRAAASVEGENALGYPESSGQLVALLAIAAVIIGGIALFEGDEPTSP